MRSSTSPRAPACGLRSRSRFSTRKSTASPRCTCSTPRWRTAARASCSRPPRRSTGSTRRCPSPRRTRSTARSRPTRQPSAPASCTCSPAHHLHGLAATCLRFFTVYGPRQRPEMAIARFIRCGVRGQPIPVLRRRATRDATTRTSTTSSDGVEAALESGVPFEIVNLGGAHPVTLAELVAHLEAATGRRAVLDRQPEQPGDVPVTYAAVEKAARLLNFRARVPLSEGLARAVEWYRESVRSKQQAGYDSL